MKALFFVSILPIVFAFQKKYNMIIRKRVVYVAMPPKIESIIHSDWVALEPDGEEQFHKAMSYLRRKEFNEFAHARDVFSEHLIGTYSILSAWGLPKEITRAGLFHTVYGGDLFIFQYFNPNKELDRAELRDIIGTESEHLTYLFGTMDRSVVNHTICTEGTLDSDSLRKIRTSGGEIEKQITTQDQAAIMIVTIADYLDQMVSVNGWRDVHQSENPLKLYPGDGKPEIAFFWFSSVCKVIAPYLPVIPPIFHHCTETITREDEVRARDKYWVAITEEGDDQEELLQEAAKLNPFIAEPHVQLAQLYFREERYTEARMECEIALECFYTLASCWDKRIPFRQWVAFTRIMYLRASRKEVGLKSMPFTDKDASLFRDSSHVSLTDLLNEM
tara:strand:- start:1125 stop:2291 length:1167 start_codon:yes stop_codon:yes gene_type:complete